MARKEFGQHKKQTIIADDPAYDVGSDEWNGDAHNQDGVLGFDEPSETLLVSGVLTSPTDTHTKIVVGAESGTVDDLDTITSTNYAVNDVVRLTSTTGDTIWVTNTGNIITKSGQRERLSDAQTFELIWNGTNWIEHVGLQIIEFDGVAQGVKMY